MEDKAIAALVISFPVVLGGVLFVANTLHVVKTQTANKADDAIASQTKMLLENMCFNYGLKLGMWHVQKPTPGVDFGAGRLITVTVRCEEAR